MSNHDGLVDLTSYRTLEDLSKEELISLFNEKFPNEEKGRLREPEGRDVLLEEHIYQQAYMKPEWAIAYALLQVASAITGKG